MEKPRALLIKPEYLDFDVVDAASHRPYLRKFNHDEGTLSAMTEMVSRYNEHESLKHQLTLGCTVCAMQGDAEAALRDKIETLEGQLVVAGAGAAADQDYMETQIAELRALAEQYKATATENYRLGIADLARATALADALESALSVALDCQQRWSRGHEDRVAKAKAALESFKADFKARS